MPSKHIASIRSVMLAGVPLQGSVKRKRRLQG